MALWDDEKRFADASAVAEPPHSDMVFIPGGAFRMGSDFALPGGGAGPSRDR